MGKLSLEFFASKGLPSPRGLLTGLASVLIAQLVLLCYYACLRSIKKNRGTIQVPPPQVTPLLSELWGHISAPESFFMVYGYLSFVWMFKLLPLSYYNIVSPVNWSHVLVQFLIVDLCTYIVHRLEHIFMSIYRKSHKSHHKFNNPKLYNAFNGSVNDTFVLILIPLFITSQICKFVNCWEFVAFGTLYATQFTLIHCEYPHLWESIFETFAIGTASDHNVHHSTIKYNYGHFFMFCDILCGTYRSIEGSTKAGFLQIMSSYASFAYLFWWFECSLLIPVFMVVHIVWFNYFKTKSPKLRGGLEDNVNGKSSEGNRGTTDLTKWHLTTEKGRQVWKYDENQPSQSFTDKYFVGLDISSEAPTLKVPQTARDATYNALKFYSRLQLEDGHWGNDYGGPLFLMPGLIIMCYISKTNIPQPYKLEMIRYLTNHQRKDGGWGLHIESESTMFGTVMNYCAMRLLGLPRGDARLTNARAWIEKHGGATSVPAWGKLWLCVLGVYHWEGMNPVPPELWILPYWLPIHPGRWWCHCRVVYLPMAWLYGKRATYPEDELTKQLKEELYIHRYDTIDWPSQRNNVMKNDSYKGHSWIFKVAFGILGLYENVAIRKLRNYALSVTLDHIRYEDTETHGICIGPVNKALDMLVEYYASRGGKSELFKLHQERIFDYLWLGKDGMKMQGYNGSQLWDTAFSLQAILETEMGDEEEFKEMMLKGYNYIDITQVQQNNSNYVAYYRHISKGAWPFSTVDHGWPISDCTAEGFTCALLMPLKLKCCSDKGISERRLFDAVNVMLSYQNKDGGWPSYENQRGPKLLELLNPADCFDKIMVDYSYIECSSSCMLALLRFRQVYPTHRTKEIDAAVRRGISFIKKNQRPDGSWHGCWGVCYTYAGWFATNALTMAKKSGVCSGSEVDEPLKKAFAFLLSKQHKDGSWGEDFKSCSQCRWVDLPQGHVVNTSWVLLSLINMSPLPEESIHKGIKWLIKMQLSNGDWEQTTSSGVFNYNCAISYSGYKNIFPIWALGKYITLFPNQSLLSNHNNNNNKKKQNKSK